MVESIIVGVIVAGAAIVSARHLLREVATGKQPCSGCADDCPLAKACASRGDAIGAADVAPDGCPIVNTRVG